MRKYKSVLSPPKFWVFSFLWFFDFVWVVVNTLINSCLMISMQYFMVFCSFRVSNYHFAFNIIFSTEKDYFWEALLSATANLYQWRKRKPGFDWFKVNNITNDNYKGDLTRNMINIPQQFVFVYIIVHNYRIIRTIINTRTTTKLERRRNENTIKSKHWYMQMWLSRKVQI